MEYKAGYVFYPDDPSTAKLMDHWLDAGIAAAHAAILTHGDATISFGKDFIKVGQ